jgi:hypothetical protein
MTSGQEEKEQNLVTGGKRRTSSWKRVIIRRWALSLKNQRSGNEFQLRRGENHHLQQEPAVFFIAGLLKNIVLSKKSDDEVFDN